MSLGPRCPPATPEASRLTLIARVFEKQSQATLELVRCLAGSTISPGRLGPGSEGLCCRPAFPGDSARVTGPAVSTNCAGRLGPVSHGLRYQPAVPGNSGLCPRALGIELLCRRTRARVRGPAGSTSSPGSLGPMPEVLRAQPDVPGDLGRVPVPAGTTSSQSDSRLGPWAHGVDQFSRVTRAGAEGLQGPPALPGDWGPCTWARSVD